MYRFVFKGVKPERKNGCIDCWYLRGAGSCWCTCELAVFWNRTSFPKGECLFWKTGILYEDVKKDIKWPEDIIL